MSKFTLTINTDHLEELVQMLTPALVAAVRGGQVAVEAPKSRDVVFSTKAEEVKVDGEKAEPTKAVEAVKTPAKRGPKPKVATETVKAAETLAEPSVQEPQPVEAEGFEDILDEKPAKKITKQEVTDAAVAVGGKAGLGRDAMIMVIKKFGTSDKLASVAEEKYQALLDALNHVATLSNKKEVEDYLVTFTV